MTDDDELAMKCRLLMNHSEAVINSAEIETLPSYHILNRIDFGHAFGFNLRMTELNAAIIIEQLKKFNKLLHQRRNNVQVLSYGLGQLPPIEMYPTMPDCTHVYYTVPFAWDINQADGIHRDVFIKAVKSEIPPRLHRESEDIGIGCGYIKPVYLMRIFQSGKIPYSKAITNWTEGSCPVCEYLWKDELFLTILHAPNSTTNDMVDIVKAFEKVWENKEELRKLT